MFSIQRKFFEPTVPCTAALWQQLTTSEQVRQAIGDGRACLAQGDQKGYAARKKALPLVCYMATFDETLSKSGVMGAWRRQASARLTGLVMLDVDHVDDPRGLYDSIPEHMFDETTCATPIMLVHVTPSGEGLRVVFKADAQRGNLSDNQHYMASILGVKADEACKDASRGSFLPTAEDVLYLNEHVFEYDNEEYDTMFGGFYRGTVPSHRGTVPESATTVPESATTVPESVLEYHGVAMQRIVDCWLARNGSPAVGDRHRTLLQLAGDLRYVCDNKSEVVTQAAMLAPFVRDIASERGMGEVESACADCCGRRMYTQIPKRLDTVLTAAGVGAADGGAGDGSGAATDEAHQRFWMRLQPLLAPPYDVAVAGVEDANKIGAVMAAGAMFCTLMTRTWYRHYDGQAHRMNPQVYIIGDPAAGKSFADRLDRNIMAAMRYADQPARQAEERYKREKRERTTSTKAQKGEALSQPEGMIRYIPSRTSNAVFYRRAINAKETVDGELMQLHLYTFDSELDSSITAQSGGSWIGKHDLELKAFHNELSGVDYANADSVNQLIPIYWTQVVTGTPISLGKKITLRNVNDGLCSRIALFRMQSQAYTMMARGQAEANHEQDVQLKQWGYYFEGLKGELKIDRLIDHVYGLCEQSAQEARETDDRVLDYLRKRAVFYATWLTVPRIMARQKGAAAGAPLTVTDDDLQFASLMYDAVIYWQDRFFGQMLLDSWENAAKEFIPRQIRKTRNSEAYEELGDIITVKDLAKLMSLNEKVAATQLSRWAQRGYIERTGQGKYRKIVKTIML